MWSALLGTNLVVLTLTCEVLFVHAPLVLCLVWVTPFACLNPTGSRRVGLQQASILMACMRCICSNAATGARLASKHTPSLRMLQHLGSC